MDKPEGCKTAENFVKLISKFAPLASGQCLVDEKVERQTRLLGVPSINLPAPYVDEIEKALRSDGPCSVLITGVAGDGKTYHGRHVWKNLGGDPKVWDSSRDKEPNLHLEITTAGGHPRTIYFIQDLSTKEYESVVILPETGETIFDLLLRSLSDETCSVVICCNHGQLLKRLRDSGLDPCVSMADRLEDTFFSQKGEVDLQGTPQIKVFDLSRLPQHRNFDEIVRQFCNHDAWRNCVSCDNYKVCQIQKNRAQLWDSEKGEFTNVEQKISRLIKLSGLDGNHLPIRNLMSLVSNALVGCNHSQSRKKGVPSDNCARARYAADPKNDLDMDFFSNILGNNFREQERRKKAIFSVLSQYECGVSGDRLWDRFLLTGGLMENSGSPDKGKNLTALYELLKDDLPGTGEGVAGIGRSDVDFDEDEAETRLQEYNEAAEKNRRKLFFLLDDKDDTYPSSWKLTSLKHAREYFSLLKKINSGGRGKAALPAEIVKGLNRIMTGGALTSASKIFVTTNGTAANCFVGNSIAAEITAENGRHDWSRLEWDAECEEELKPPVIDFCFDDAVEGASVRFALTPSRYECLAAAADGALLETFSKKMIGDFMNLKSELIVAYERLQADSETSEDSLNLELTSGGKLKTIRIHYAE